MKISKEIKTGLISVIAIALLVAGVNFLKGSSFFGGDDVYYAYFPDSGGIMPASSVSLNGVPVGKIISVEYVAKNPIDKRVKITFNIQDKKIKIPVGSEIKVGSIDLFSKGIIITIAEDLSKGYYKPGDKLTGVVAADMIQQVQAYADPITQKMQSLISNVDRAISSLSAFWDTTATSEIEESIAQVKIAINKIGHVANEVEGLVIAEKEHLSNIFTNVESITLNIKKSNEEVRAIIGNVKKVSDEMVTADFKTVIENAKETIKALNRILSDANAGKGSLGKLMKDEDFYNELVKTNTELQDLMADLKLHPEKYINFSFIGAKNKGLALTPNEEKKLRKVLDTIK
jgi:phospholipid/cholesterol/gamma-HCH transport system substrate-binding protein